MTLTYARRAQVPFAEAEFSRELVLPQDYLDDPVRSPQFGLRGSDASCPEIWNGVWPGAEPVDGHRVFPVFELPSMIFAERVVLLDSAAEAVARPHGVGERLASCRDAWPNDVHSEFEPDLPGELTAAFRMTTTHMHDPFGTRSDTPMQRTTNFIVVTIGRAVVVLTGMQAGDGEVDPAFVAFATDAINRVDEVVRHQDELLRVP